MSKPIHHMIPGAPDPVAPFSHAVEQDGWVFVTGQMPFTGIASNSPYPRGIAAQTHQVMKNLTRVLEGCGLGLQHVVAARIFLTHFKADYAKMNRVYAGYFPPGKRPARTCVGVTGLARGARVEIDFIARRPAAVQRARRSTKKTHRAPLDNLGPVNHYRACCVVAKIVGGKALGAAHIANMGKTSNAASGDFGLNPPGRGTARTLLRRPRLPYSRYGCASPPRIASRIAAVAHAC